VLGDDRVILYTRAIDDTGDVVVTTEIATRRRTKIIKFEKKRVWSRHHSYYRKLWKPIKKSKVCEKPDFGSRSRLRVGKVLAPHNVCPKTVPLIICAKVMWFFQNI